MTPEPYRVDVHHHILTLEYMSMLEGMGSKKGGGRVLPAWDASGTLEWMDKFGIATVFASLPGPVYLD